MLHSTDMVCGQPRPTTASTLSTTGSDCFIPTIGGTAGARSVCIFPFNYRGITYTGCSSVDNGGVPWCYTSFNYENDHLWGNCGGMSPFPLTHPHCCQVYSVLFSCCPSPPQSREPKSISLVALLVELFHACISFTRSSAGPHC